MWYLYEVRDYVMPIAHQALFEYSVRLGCLVVDALYAMSIIPLLSLEILIAVSHWQLQ